jgi:hypothetical protein
MEGFQIDYVEQGRTMCALIYSETGIWNGRVLNGDVGTESCDQNIVLVIRPRLRTDHFPTKWQLLVDMWLLTRWIHS